MKAPLRALWDFLDRVWERPDPGRAEEELDLHLTLLAGDLERRGLPAEAARQEALRRLGDPEKLAAECAAADRGPESGGSSTRAARAAVVVAVIPVLWLTTYIQQVLWRLPFYPALYKRFPYYVPESFKNLVEIGVCLAALAVVHRISPRGAERELALSGRAWPAFLFGLVCSSPMLIGFVLTRAGEKLSPLPILYLTVISPFTEELVFRAYAFRQLSLRARWPFWAAGLPVALFAGLGHIEKGQSSAEVAQIFLLIASGSFAFCFLMHCWKSVWVPFALHFSMNLWWQLFNVSRTAVGGWFPFTLQSTSILLAILLTLRYRPGSPERTSRQDTRMRQSASPNELEEHLCGSLGPSSRVADCHLHGDRGLALLRPAVAGAPRRLRPEQRL